MATRARRNIELIVERLHRDGYRFHTNDDAHPPGLFRLSERPRAAPAGQ
jgi:hypothetical protein